MKARVTDRHAQATFCLLYATQHQQDSTLVCHCTKPVTAVCKMDHVAGQEEPSMDLVESLSRTELLIYRACCSTTLVSSCLLSPRCAIILTRLRQSEVCVKTSRCCLALPLFSHLVTEYCDVAEGDDTFIVLLLL